MKAFVVAALLAGGPTAAYAQPAIAGSVKNPAGEVLPGVLVEASSPALIEITRSAVTDGNGRYRIEDLRPGTYKVRFTLAGWTPFEQGGVELTGSLTATVNAQLGIRGITDTITVTAENPLVDIHAPRREVTLTGEVVKAVPTIRSYNALVGLIPGVVTSINDVVTSTATTSFPIHGGRTNEGRLLLDGLNIGSPPSGNSATRWPPNYGRCP